MSSPKKNTVNCPNCGAPVNRKYGETVVCEYCGTALRPDEHERIMLYERDRQEISDAKTKAYNEIMNEHKSQQEALRRERDLERQRAEYARRRAEENKAHARKVATVALIALFVFWFGTAILTMWGFFNILPNLFGWSLAAHMVSLIVIYLFRQKK